LSIYLFTTYLVTSLSANLNESMNPPTTQNLSIPVSNIWLALLVERSGSPHMKSGGIHLLIVFVIK